MEPRAFAATLGCINKAPNLSEANLAASLAWEETTGRKPKTIHHVFVKTFKTQIRFGNFDETEETLSC